MRYAVYSSAPSQRYARFSGALLLGGALLLSGCVADPVVPLATQSVRLRASFTDAELLRAPENAGLARVREGRLHWPGRRSTADQNLDGSGGGSSVAADEVFCVIRITYYVESGIIISVEILYCVVSGPGDGGGGDPEENDCTKDQIDIAQEYEEKGMSGWSCEMFDVSVTAGQGTHGHLYGYLTTTYQTKSPLLIADLEEEIPNIGAIVVSSDWRCPVGNEAVNGRPQSQHMHGTAGDFAFSGTITESDYERLTQIAYARYGAGWVSSHGSYTRHVHVDWRNH